MWQDYAVNALKKHNKIPISQPYRCLQSDERKLQAPFSVHSTDMSLNRRYHRLRPDSVGTQTGLKGALSLMTIKSKLTSLAAATAIAASTFSPLAATSAKAGGLYSGNGAELHYAGRRGRGYYKRGHRKHRYHRHHARPYYYKRKKDRTGKYIALGIGALMLGIIASQAGRHHHRPYDYYDY